jgi:hypothetical protein
MDQLGSEWEVVDKNINRGGVAGVFLWIIFQLLFGPAYVNWTCTWTVRNAESGDVFSVTAASEREAVDKIKNGKFDQGPCLAPGG